MPLTPSPEVCFSVLHHLYLLSERKAGVAVLYQREQEQLGLSLEQQQASVAWLQLQRLVRLVGVLDSVSLTAFGVATVERALASPDVPAAPFPAVAGFYGLGEQAPIGLCHTTLQVWLDQLDGCAGALGQGSVSQRTLEHTLHELEEQVLSSSVDPQSLQLSLQELKSSL